ncbi:hypothetical protein QUF58_12980 [Anaerolineales bacterium HSG24]|nr:hypothetical protein [Anaerolineales bacterium HSG24]
MSKNNNDLTNKLDLIWGTDVEAVSCEVCYRSYLLPATDNQQSCPYCNGTLVSLAEVDSDGQKSELNYSQPPELCIPFAVDPDSLKKALKTFAGSGWFAPGDLTSKNLRKRIQPLYIPRWLVDSEVQALWQAEVGFNYKAITHQDKFDDHTGGWKSKQVTETRVRWEARVGKLQRNYDNVSAPALEQEELPTSQYDLKSARPYKPSMLRQGLVMLPNRSPDDAWPEALPEFQSRAQKECRRACQVKHFRDFRWQADYTNHNWTLLLLPLYVTYYLDDDKTPQQVFLHGQTGQLQGTHRASMQKARQVASIIVAVATVIFVLSMLVGFFSVVAPPLIMVAMIGLFTAMLVGLGAVIPLSIAWFNR